MSDTRKTQKRPRSKSISHPAEEPVFLQKTPGAAVLPAEKTSEQDFIRMKEKVIEKERGYHVAYKQCLEDKEIDLTIELTSKMKKQGQALGSENFLKGLYAKRELNRYLMHEFRQKQLLTRSQRIQLALKDGLTEEMFREFKEPYNIGSPQQTARNLRHRPYQAVTDASLVDTPGTFFKIPKSEENLSCRETSVSESNVGESDEQEPKQEKPSI